MSSYLSTINDQLQKSFKAWVNDLATQADQSSTLNRVKMSTALNLITKFVGQSIPFATRNGFKVIDFRPGYVKAFIPLKPNKNHFNSMYAGALFTVAELPGGIISIFSFDERFYPVLRDLKIEFLRMAKSDVTVEFEITPAQLRKLESEADKHGKCPFVLEGEIKDKDGVVVAKTFANYQVRSK